MSTVCAGPVFEVKIREIPRLRLGLQFAEVSPTDVHRAESSASQELMPDASLFGRRSRDPFVRSNPDFVFNPGYPN